MAKSSHAPSVAWAALRGLVVLNARFGAAILGLLVATLVAEQWTFAALGIAPSSSMRPMMNGLRLVAALGLAAGSA
jgi:hypothetical protein